MERPLVQIYEILQKMVGFHRKLLDITNAERDAIVHANVEDLQKILTLKQSIIDSIHEAEQTRVKATSELATLWSRSPNDLTLKNIIGKVHSVDPKFGEQLRSTFHALTEYIQRVMDQNSDNRSFLEKSLDHNQKMRRNVLGESSQKGSTYTQQGQHLRPNPGSRFISKEV